MDGPHRERDLDVALDPAEAYARSPDELAHGRRGHGLLPLDLTDPHLFGNLEERGEVLRGQDRARPGALPVRAPLPCAAGRADGHLGPLRSGQEGGPVGGALGAHAVDEGSARRAADNAELPVAHGRGP